MPSSWTIECSCFDDVSLQFLFLQEGVLRSKAPLMLFLSLCYHKPCRLKREKNQSVEWRKSKMNNFLPLTHCDNHTTHSSSAWWCVHLQDFLFSCPSNLYDWKCDLNVEEFVCMGFDFVCQFLNHVILLSFSIWWVSFGFVGGAYASIHEVSFTSTSPLLVLLKCHKSQCCEQDNEEDLP